MCNDDLTPGVCLLSFSFIHKMCVIHKYLGLFLCISYYQGLTHYHSQQQHYAKAATAAGLPIVLLPEWPLPLDIVLQYAPPSTPSSPPVLSLLSHPQPYNFKTNNRREHHSSPPYLEAKPSWESFAEFVPLEPHNNHVRKRILVREKQFLLVMTYPLKLFFLLDSEYFFLLTCSSRYQI
jgi:hypothetical protein